jgi:transposase
MKIAYVDAFNHCPCLTRENLVSLLLMGNYSLDLRQRIVDTYLAGEGSQRNIAKRFRVSLTTVKTYLKLYQKTGKLLPKEHTRGRKPAISNKQLSVVKILLKEQSDMTLTELCTTFEEQTGTRVGSTSMWRAIKKINLTYKKRLYMLTNKIVKMLKQNEKHFYNCRKDLSLKGSYLLMKLVFI